MSVPCSVIKGSSVLKGSFYFLLIVIGRTKWMNTYTLFSPITYSYILRACPMFTAPPLASSTVYASPTVLAGSLVAEFVFLLLVMVLVALVIVIVTRRRLKYVSYSTNSLHVLYSINLYA